ncbi:hypothetical protein [Nannocystis sp. SCPEA4]|uniref:hypothetical protein n=1 Tax=Nannocystis sp. SCPEA4 TaxID=2996787 RepID=UPI00226F82E8|nr:hypothetical protein [Nannocystis sp. SCPEA4]MCY1062140.1 hypothetical protein [Nannocystis sp. SCPEA4]
MTDDFHYAVPAQRVGAQGVGAPVVLLGLGLTAGFAALVVIISRRPPAKFAADLDAEARECKRFSWTPWAKQMDLPKGHWHVEYQIGLSEQYGGEGTKVRALQYDGTFQLPLRLDGRSEESSGLEDHEWFGWVAYRKAYPQGPLSPEPGSDWAAALARAQACVEARLLEGK